MSKGNEIMSAMSKWVILTYLDGNSELEPEMAAAKCDMEKATLCQDVKVLLEIGLVDQETVKIVRPGGRPVLEMKRGTASDAIVCAGQVAGWRKTWEKGIWLTRTACMNSSDGGWNMMRRSITC